MSYGSHGAVYQDGWVGRSHVAFAGEQTLVILRFAIITSQGKLPTNMKEVSSPVLRKVVFQSIISHQLCFFLPDAFERPIFKM